MSFNTDKQIGEQIEREFALLLSPHYDTIEITSGNFPDYDILCEKMFDWLYPLKVIDTYEIKLDRLHSRTGNIAIEFMYNNTLSGIATTKAKYWVHVTNEKFFVFETRQLKDWIKDSWKYLIKFKGGDDNKSLLVIVSDNDIINLPFLRILKRAS